MLSGRSKLPLKFFKVPTRGVAVTATLTAALALVSCDGAKFGGASKTSPATRESSSAGAGDEPVPTNNNTDANSNGGTTTPGSTGSEPTVVPNGPTTTTSSTTSSGLPGLLNTISQIVSTTTSTNTTVQTSTVPSNMQLCSQSYYVPATANPYLASAPSSETLTYTLDSGDPPTPTDYVGAESPVLVAPANTNCISAGMALYFSVHGGMTYNQSKALEDANGDTTMVVQHQLGATNGISQIIAPIDALVGVFLTDADPSTQTAPAGLDFSSQTSRDYTSLSPQIGQIFFIGTGITSGGTLHQVIVPQGATRLYFGAMDDYQWNNNAGGLYGAIMTAKSS